VAENAPEKQENDDQHSGLKLQGVTLSPMQIKEYLISNVLVLLVS
jgi:hypothetical protein